jgi:hypothetical protein
MQPKLSKAERKISFPLNEEYMTSLFVDIVSAGIVQYHHLLVVYDADKEPCLFIGSEWSLHDPSYMDQPILGIFTTDGHQNWGNDSTLLDDALFVLKAFESAREILGIHGTELAEGEAWAMAQVLKRMQDSDNHLYTPFKQGYMDAMRKYDERMVAYLKKSFIN